MMVSLAHPGEKRSTYSVATPTYRQAALQEDQTIEFHPTETKTSSVFKAALLLSFPAIWIAAIFTALLHLHESEPMWIGVGTVFVPILWYSIGKWIDQQFGTEAARPNQNSRISRGSRTVLRVIAAFFGVCFVSIALPTFHHRSSETNFLSAAGILWCASYLACSLWGERRKKNAVAAQH